jgi:hypothetical protein
MAVIGPHAMGLSQGDPEDESSPVGQRGQGGFHAVRFRADNPERLRGERPPQNYETVFSTGHTILDGQLGALVNALSEREREGKDLWQRGEGVVLISRQQGKPWSWVVWDAGHVHA